MKEEHGMDSSRMNRGCCGANNMQNRRAASNNMELKMEPRNFPRKMQHVDPVSYTHLTLPTIA